MELDRNVLSWKKKRIAALAIASTLTLALCVTANASSSATGAASPTLTQAALAPAWSASNGFGQAEALFGTTPQGQQIEQITYLSPEGRTVEIAKTPRGVRLELPAGGIRVLDRPAGGAVLTVFLTSNGAPAGQATSGPHAAQVLLDPQGEPVDAAEAARAARVQKLLWSRSSRIQEEMREFARIAGVNISATLLDFANGNSLPQPYSTTGCILASVATGFAFAAWAVEPIDPLAFWGFAAAYTEASYACKEV